MRACTDGATVRAGVQTTRRAGQAIVPGTGADGDGARTADAGGLRAVRETVVGRIARYLRGEEARLHYLIPAVGYPGMC